MYILKHVQEQDYFLVCLNKHLTDCMVGGKCCIKTWWKGV